MRPGSVPAPFSACPRAQLGALSGGKSLFLVDRRRLCPAQNRLSVGARRGLRGTKCRGEGGSVAGGMGCPAAPQPQQHPHPSRPLHGWQQGPGAAAAPQPYLALHHRPCVPEGFRAAISSLQSQQGLNRARAPGLSSSLPSLKDLSVQLCINTVRSFQTLPASREPTLSTRVQRKLPAARCPLTADTHSIRAVLSGPPSLYLFKNWYSCRDTAGVCSLPPI